jgi:hypothetical protein
MTDDPIVDEVRRAGEAYLAKFNFDIKAACEDLRRRTEEAQRAGRRIVFFPPKRVAPERATDKKAG